MRKNYLKLFVDYARKNGVGYNVYSTGEIAAVYATNTSYHRERQLGGTLHKLGSKAAYEWLVKTHEEAK